MGFLSIDQNIVDLSILTERIMNLGVAENGG